MRRYKPKQEDVEKLKIYLSNNGRQKDKRPNSKRCENRDN